MPAQPTGTVSFLFTDLEGSTKLWERHPTAMRTALARHDDLLRGAIAAHNGYVFKTIGDAFCAAFATPAAAVAAAATAQRSLAAEPWGETGSLRARMAVHTGEAEVRDGDYFGQPVNRVARLLAIGHGNQILLSEATRQAIGDALPERFHLRDAGKHRLKDLSRPVHVYQLVSPDVPANLKRLRSQPSPVAGGAAALGTAAAGIVSFRAQTRSASEEIGPGLLSPLSLFTGVKGLVIEFSTYNEYLLLAVGLLLLAATLAVGGGRWRAGRREIGLRAGEPGRVAGWLVNQRTLGFLVVGAATVLGAYAYQQYLWRVALPIPDDAIGFAVTREAAAASFQDQLADSLYAQGQAQEVVVRELPVRFDAGDTGTARELGERIGAEAVIIYRVDETGPDGARAYVAYVVFTDPSVGLVVGGPAAGAQGPVQVKEGLGVPVLRTETLEELVNAAAGIIAYDEHRLREAIGHLELAVPRQVDAPNTGIVNFYLGNARNLDGETAAAASAWETAAAFYERRIQAGERLGPQDELILVKTYTERGRVAALPGDWDTALAWYEKALVVREDLVARAAGLERPSDVPATYARLFTLMADAYRGQGKTEDQAFWQGRAADELDALAANASPDDPDPLIQESTARLFIGDCVSAGGALSRALALQPDNLDAHTNAGVVYLLQGRPDLAAESWRQVIALHPDDVNARMLLAGLLVQQGVAPGYFEAASLLEAEHLYRDVIRIDPTNDAAHEQIAELATIRAQAAVFDSTALATGDELSMEKSQVLWPADPARQDQALAAYGVAIEMRRILAAELRPGDPTAEATVATAYAERQGFRFTLLLNQPPPEAAPTPVLPRTTQAMGEELLADAAQIREWTDEVVNDPAAARLARLHAWAARVRSFERVWAWHAFFAVDEARAAEAEREYRAAVADAVAFGEGTPVGELDEIAPLRLVYFSAVILARIVDEDEATAAAFDDKIDDLTARERSGRAAGIGHLTTFCREAQETEAGDAALAAGDGEAALARYDAALAANPNHPPALLGAGRVLFARDDLPGAIARAASAAEAAPDDPAVWADLALYRLAAGDEAAGEVYDRFLETVAPRPPQQRMATLGAVLADLGELATDQPDSAPRVVAILPRIAALLDGMAGEGTGTYQYPALYANLGGIALVAGAPQDAEPWLRRAIVLDPHQPTVHADLVVAVVAQGHDATAEIGQALAETSDPLWLATSDFAPDRVLAMMEREARSIAARLPGQVAIDDFLTAIAAEADRLGSGK